MEKAINNMMTNNNMNRWCAVHTAYKSERKLMQRLNAAGYTAFCPMQIAFKKWNGRTKEVFEPLFSGCLFVEDTVDATSFLASQNAAILVDSEGNNLSICAEKTELSTKFAQLLK
nr:UpxY family transcription antiterminator [uncultured Bacteroides sp.]